MNPSIKAQSGGLLQSPHVVGSRVFYMSLIQTEGRLALHTSREGNIEVPCTGFVRIESLADGTEVIVGDVVLTQENALLLEPAVAALTEHMRNQTPAAYSGDYYPHPREEDAQTEAIKCSVHIVALAGKDLRFTTENVAREEEQAQMLNQRF
jgi:hypothetical protein